MTKTKTSATPAALAAEELDIDSLMDHLNTRRREITIGAIVVAALVGGVVLWRMSVNQKNDRAERAFAMASDALSAGNRPLAGTELQAVADRYRDTPAGVEAAMVLAQLDFESSRWADGIKVLEAITKSSVIENFKAPVDGLMGGAYADLKKYDDAVKHYQAASDEAGYPAAKDIYKADAARVLVLAGKKDDARKIWEDLASRPDSPSVAEAKVRLGELDAGPANKN
jgi:predicted negative regulator of RcsB-dependent stress response